jgi:hypothetical protein
MSTHDSLDTVFNCLSKEAADFLVKPVRKNELKNLWQHVWRRCNSSSIGGSRIGTGKEDVRKSHVGSDNNVTGSNGDSENISTGLNVQGGSDNGSGNHVCNIKPFPVLALKVVSVILIEETHSPSLSFDMWSVPALSCIDLRFQEGIQ